ncbi:uncharacterized protein LDX57_007736 [Aspergillus melleus]|uniref:uncharacterized protein n=1 Tax=Aspergillus melleus TaxID=138277 RepID=UPI001E8D94F3|nr:uncharacterized protein LDX57_007736 [Aspergillus melleus]KAH8430065.1 hypothetical protein LDX57_007736 [Aspergillus melleus]
MPSGLELLSLVSSIQSTIEVIDRVITAFKDFRDQEEHEKDLRLKFQTHCNTLRRLHPLIKRMHETSVDLDVSDSERKLSDDVKIRLDTIQVRLGSKLKVTSGDDNGSSLKRYSLGSRTAWAGWRKREMFELEKSLFDWIQRVELSCSVLEATQRLTVGRGGGRGSSGDDRVALLIDIYKKIKARDITSIGLLKPRKSLSFESNMSHRTLAYYTGDDGQQRQVIVEYTAKSYTEHDTEAKIDSIEQATCDLAKTLVHSDPERTLILRALGYFHDVPMKKFGLIYEIPPSEQPREAEAATGAAPKILTLRDILAKRPRFSLSQKLRLCCDIAKAVLYIHVMDWVHKGLRPDNILFLESASKSTVIDENFAHILPPCYVAGFEHSRGVQMESDRTGDGKWDKNLYHHPNRQGLQGNSEYSMLHDIYSVGVLLLEIGLWGRTPLVPFRANPTAFDTSTPLRMKESLLELVEGTRRGIPKRSGLAAFMGDKYASVVRYCLEVSETSAEAPIGYQFVQEVWVKLDSIRAAL